MYKAVLAILLKLCEEPRAAGEASHAEQEVGTEGRHQQQQQQQPRQAQLEAFLASQPVATSIPFISWLAELEAKAAGASKAQLAWLCELLVVARERADREGQEALYADTLRLLSGGDRKVTALLADEPRQYALALAEGMSGQPVALRGYGAAYDALLAAAPPAALTAEAVARGHALAEDLAADLSSRRKSTLAAMLGRTRVTPEQQSQLMGGSPASRICDLLLTLGSSEERLGLLPDCFTPPPEEQQQQEQQNQQQQQEQQQGEAEETEELWCTPMQLLNEIEARLKAAAAAGAGRQQLAAAASAAGSSSSSSRRATSEEPPQWPPTRPPAALPPGDGAPVLGEAAAAAALHELRDAICASWLESLPRPPGPVGPE